MREVSLNDPLSGAEIKDIIGQEIRAAMDKNCTLSNDVAYAGVTVSYELKIGFVRAPTKETLVWGNAKSGEAPTGQPEAVTGTYASDSPNQAREEHDMPTPVLQQTPNGPRRAKVHVQKVVKSGKQK